MDQPITFSEARASRIINALKPSYTAVVAMKKRHDELYEALRDEFYFEDEEVLDSDRDDIWE